jgi:hypothetical protein
VRKPHRHKPENKRHKLDPEKCVASVAHGSRWPSFHQCSNNRKPGTEWCGRHTHIEATDDMPKLWTVYEGKLVGFTILKESKKVIVIDDVDLAFDCKEKIKKDKDGNPCKGHRTRLKALLAHRVECIRDLKRAHEEVEDAERDLTKAEKLLNKEQSKN